MSDRVRFDMIPPINRRLRRAQMLAASVMHAIRRALPPETNLRNVDDALLELFHSTDAEIITEHDRREAGLPARNELGLSPEEHRLIEAQRMLVLTQPPAPMLMTIGGSKREAELEKHLRAFLFLFSRNEQGKEEDQVKDRPDDEAWTIIPEYAHFHPKDYGVAPVVTAGQVRRAREALSPSPTHYEEDER